MSEHSGNQTPIPRVGDTDLARWHDIECGTYREDFDLWAGLADREAGPILDVGAGTGRLSLHLIRAGHTVFALDREADFVDAIARRAAAENLPVTTLVADATDFTIEDTQFGLIIVAMSTVQLIPETSRQAFLNCVRRHTVSGGLLAIAITEKVELFDPTMALVPIADSARYGDARYVSQPIAIRAIDGGYSIERNRQIISANGEIEHEETDSTRIVRFDGKEIASEAERVGFSYEGSLPIPATDDHIASTVVLLRG